MALAYGGCLLEAFPPPSGWKGIRGRFIITKGYSNRSALEYPFFHAWGSDAGVPPCKPPLALQVPSGKGVDRLLGFPVAGRAGKTDCRIMVGVL